MLQISPDHERRELKHMMWVNQYMFVSSVPAANSYTDFHVCCYVYTSASQLMKGQMSIVWISGKNLRPLLWWSCCFITVSKGGWQDVTQTLIQQTQQLYITPQQMIKTDFMFYSKMFAESLLSLWYEMCDYCHVVIIPFY